MHSTATRRPVRRVLPYNSAVSAACALTSLAWSAWFVMVTLGVEPLNGYLLISLAVGVVVFGAATVATLWECFRP